ncbi:MAG: DNA alkylation repair protein [Saprospiraceae bacterium]
MKTSESKELYDELMHRMKSEEHPTMAVAMSKYMRDLFPFFGVNSPMRKQIVKDFIADIGKPSIDDIPGLFELLWETPQREAQYLVRDLGEKYLKNSSPSWFPMYESFISRKSWWDTIDFVVPALMYPILSEDQDLRYEASERWNQSDNLWLVRASLIYQLKFKEKIDFEQLKRFILNHAESKEFFVQKAAAWALRQHAYLDSQAVIDFVQSTNLPSLTKREALKHV